MSYKLQQNPLKLERWSVRKILELYGNNQIIAPKEYQRVFKAELPFQRSYVTSLVTNTCSSGIHLRTMKDGSYEMLDCLQRITSLINYVHKDEFPLLPEYKMNVSGVEIEVPAMVYSKLQKHDNFELIYERFMNTEIPVTVYAKEMTDQEASEVFQKLNQQNKMTHQEIMNSIRGRISEWVREVARYGELYPKLKLIQVIKLQAKSKSPMIIDEMIAKFCCFEWLKSTGKLGEKTYVSNSTVEEMYRNTIINDRRLEGATGQKGENQFKNLIKDVEKRSEFIRKLVVGSGDSTYTTKISEMMILFNFTYGFDTYYGKQVKIDYKKLGKELFNILRELQNPKSKVVKNVLLPGNKKTEFSYLKGRYAPHEIKRKNELIFKALHKLSLEKLGLVLRDDNRAMKKQVVLKRLHEQEYISPPSGKQITADEAIGGHRKPYCDGHPSDYSNCVALSVEDNQKMSNKYYEDYMINEKKKNPNYPYNPL